jgi:hypothetical protein
MIDENLPSKLILITVPWVGRPLVSPRTTSLSSPVTQLPSILEAPLGTPIANFFSFTSVLPQEQLTEHKPKYHIPPSAWKRAGARV